MTTATATEFAPGLAIQGFTAPLSLSQFKLIAFDMDSTLISIECIDEIADAVGRKAEVAAITEAAMRGEITDFKESLRRRLALLKGVTLADMERVYSDRLKINPGATELIAACQKAGMKVLLVSGGFTFFADRVKARLNIDFARSNQLEIVNGELTTPNPKCVSRPWWRSNLVDWTACWKSSSLEQLQAWTPHQVRSDNSRYCTKVLVLAPASALADVMPDSIRHP